MFLKKLCQAFKFNLIKKGLESHGDVLEFQHLINSGNPALKHTVSVVSYIMQGFSFYVKQNSALSRLKDESAVTDLITKLQKYLEKAGSRSEVCRVYLRRIEHIYYKVCCTF